MRRTLLRSGAMILMAALGLTGCSDRGTPLAPDPTFEVPPPFFSYAPARGFDILLRRQQLREDRSASRRIGPEGGSIEIDDAGITLVVPAGALEETTDITVTALAGRAVAIEFAPHGLQFRVPAQVLVDYDDTEARETIDALLDDFKKSDAHEDQADGMSLDSFLGVYYEGDPTSEMGVNPLEILGTFLVGDDIVFSISHFSGYACASG